MRTMTGKLIAAGIVLALVVTGFIRLGGHGSSIALGDIAESLRQVPWVHVTATIDAPGQRGRIEEWDSLDRHTVIKIDPDGVITYRDYGTETMYVYQPGTNTVTVSPTTGRFNIEVPGSPVAAIEMMISFQEEEGAQVTYEAVVHEGIAAQEIRIISDRQDVTLICDRETGLPLSMETVAALPDTSERATVSAAFDYPAEGPADIYSLGVPADAKVVDNRPAGTAADLVERVQSQFDAGYEDHIVVMLESYVDANELLEPAQITVMWQQGPKKRTSSYHAYNFTGSKSDWPTLYPLVKDAWPELTVPEVLALVSDDVAETQWIFDGTASTNRSNFSGQVNVQTIRTDMFQHGGIDSLASLARPNPSALTMAGSTVQKKLEPLPADPNRPGLVGFRIATEPSRPDGRLPGTTTQTSVDSYWFDPAHDYLLMEQSTRAERDEGVSEFVRSTVGTAQTPAGEWYPTRIRITSSYPDRNGQIHHIVRAQRILLDASPVFEEETFDAARLRNRDGSGN
ncbi:MAG: hypothetical protein JW993_18155 [Sedimentisphaerales bacterium]|nr:hypothetical protein [Sedimentisphaerales bacterium]